MERAARLLHGPALAGEPLDVPLRAVVGGKDGTAAVALGTRLRLEPGGRGLSFEGPGEGDPPRAAKAAALAARVSVEFLIGGILPYPWDSWKGRLDGEGVLHAALGPPDRPWGGVEATFDGRGLPVAAWTLRPGEGGALRRAARARFRWEPAGERYRLAGMDQAGEEGVPLLHCSFEWGPAGELLPRRWTVVLEDRVTRFSREGHGAPVPDLPPPMAYYLDPRPRALLDLVKGQGDRLLAPAGEEPDFGDLMSVSLAAVLRAEPALLPLAARELGGAGRGPGRVLVRAVARAADRDLGKTLDQLRPAVHESVRAEIDAVRGGLPRPPAIPVPMDDWRAGAAALDACWHHYVVSGDPAALRPIVYALRGLDGEMAGLLVGGAARWSLTSNARRLPGVRECLERDLPAVPAAIRPRVQAILDATAPGEPGGRR